MSDAANSGAAELGNRLDLDPSISDDDEFTTGDFEVITADNVRFRVPSEFLFAASPVWKEAHNLSVAGQSDNPLSMSFTDDEVETAEVFRAFLGLVQRAVLPHSIVKTWTIRDLVLFLQKWECTTALNIALMHLREYVRKLDEDAKTLRQNAQTHRKNAQTLRKTAPDDHTAIIFWAAAQADDIATCTLVLTVFHSLEWGDHEGINYDKPLAGASCWNPLSWDRWRRSILPERYAWALSRAYLLFVEERYEALGSTFQSFYSNATTQEKLESEVW